MYFTYKIKQKVHHTPEQHLQYDFRNVYNNTLPQNIDIPEIFEEPQQYSSFFKTFTVIKNCPYYTPDTSFIAYYNTLFDAVKSNDILQHLLVLASLARSATINLQLPTEQRYRSFLVPKASGELRQIDAPLGETKVIQTDFKNWLENIHTLTHNAAHAYVKGRSTKTALQVHQQFESKYFLKLDIKDFFGQHTLGYIIQQFRKIFPIAGFLTASQEMETRLTTVLKGCLLNGKLPQGSPASPLITNICMIPIDYAITKLCGKYHRYTRYADDILISSKTKFNYTEWTQKIQEILSTEQTPFELKTEKTRFGSSSGRNWNLGLMLNKDNNITLGHKKKEVMRALVHNFIKDHHTDQRWSRQATEVLQGQLSYFHAIEPDYTDTFIRKTNEKYSTDLKALIKAILR